MMAYIHPAGLAAFRALWPELKAFKDCPASQESWGLSAELAFFRAKGAAISERAWSNFLTMTRF